MKIAVVTDDGETISAHFGQAALCAVFTVEDGQIANRELREKPHHAAHEHGHDHNHNHQGGGLFRKFLPLIADCQVLISRGMGQRAFDNLRQAGIEAVMTDIRDVETAVQAYLDGSITSNPKRVHIH